MINAYVIISYCLYHVNVSDIEDLWLVPLKPKLVTMAVNKECLYKIVCEAIDHVSEELYALSQDIWNHPELKFEEHYAHKVFFLIALYYWMSLAYLTEGPVVWAVSAQYFEVIFLHFCRNFSVPSIKVCAQFNMCYVMIFSWYRPHKKWTDSIKIGLFSFVN